MANCLPGLSLLRTSRMPALALTWSARPLVAPAAILLPSPAWVPRGGAGPSGVGNCPPNPGGAGRFKYALLASRCALYKRAAQQCAHHKSSLSVTHTRSRSLLLAVLCAGIFLTHPPAYSLREKILFEVPQVHATFWRRRTEMCKNNRTARPCPRRASPRGPGCFRNSVQQDAAAPRCYSPWSPVAGRRARNTPTATPLPGTRSAPLTVTRNSIASTATATHRV